MMLGLASITRGDILVAGARVNGATSAPHGAR